MYDGANRTQLREALARFGLRPNQKLGQNFLCDGNLCDAIVQAAGALADRTVVEIGPGGGALTCRLLRAAQRVVAIELDGGLCRLLAEVFEGEQTLTLLHEDALKVPIDALALTGPTTMVANLPYYVTTALLMRYLMECPEIDTFVVMMQREVAARLCAPPGSKTYGSLSLAVQYHATVETVLSVPAQCFFPAPQVESCVVRLCRRRYPVQPRDEEALFKLIPAAFAMRRKTLFNNLSALPSLGKQGAAALLDRSGIEGTRRAETLSLEEFIALADALEA